ncbi:MAG: MFS transporter, partial [Propionibacteriaceae bacterium]
MTTTAAPRRFAALRDRHARPYLFTAGLSMMGDNIEHVITYWVLWQTFHSPALVGFQVVSHWLPFLVLS